MSFADKAAYYAKAIEAACGAGAMFGASLLDHQEMLPEGSVYWINLAIGAFTVFRVWLVKNEKLIKDVAEAGEDLYESMDEEMDRHDRRTEAFELPAKRRRHREG